MYKRINNKTQNQCRGRAQRLGIEKMKNKYKYVTKQGKKYVVQLYINGKSMRFGTFDSKEEARKVAMEKAREYGKAI